MPTAVETLSIEIRGNASGVEQAARKASAAISALQDANIDIAADTSEAQQALKAAQAQADGFADGKYEADITADTSAAESAIDGLSNKLKTVLAGVGIGATIKKMLDFGMDAVGSASNWEQTLGKATQLLDSTALQSVLEFAEGKNQKYGLNKTGILDMTTNFAGAYKSMGIESQQAAEYAERLSNAAIDYASVLNKTPAEVGEIMMSLMRGNTAVADNISLYGLTADKMMKKAKELKEKGLIPEGMDEASAKYVALLNIIEENSDTLGFTGDWDRTYEQYANQTTVLAEQWETLKTNVGTLLQPAALAITTALNDILTGINKFTEGLKEKSFTDDVNGYFGTMQITKQDLEPIVQDITGPMNAVTSQMKEADEALAAANQAYQSSYGTLMKTLQLLVAGGDVDENDVDEGVNAYRDSLTQMLEADKGTLITGIMSFIGTGEQWEEAQKTAISNITNWYDALIKQAKDKADELAKTIYESIHDDNQLDAEELAQIREQAEELNSQVKGSASGKAKALLEGQDLEKNGFLSAESIQTAYDVMMGGLAESMADYDARFMEIKEQLYTTQAIQQAEKERLGAEAFKETYGIEDPIDAQAIVADMRDAYDAAWKGATGETVGALTDLIVNSLIHGFEGAAGLKNDQSFWDNYRTEIQEILKMGDLAEMIRGMGNTANPSAQKFLAIYDYIAGLEAPTTAEQQATMAMDPLASIMMFNELSGSAKDLSGFLSVLGLAQRENEADSGDAEAAEAMRSAVESGDGAIVEAIGQTTSAVNGLANRPVMVNVQLGKYGFGSDSYHAMTKYRLGLGIDNP